MSITLPTVLFLVSTASQIWPRTPLPALASWAVEATAEHSWVLFTVDWDHWSMETQEALASSGQ